MITNVVKRDGTKEPFDAGKIKKAIEATAMEAGIAKERGEEVAAMVTRSIVKILEGREEVPTTEIRERILGQLQELEPSVSQAWLAYDTQHKTK